MESMGVWGHDLRKVALCIPAALVAFLLVPFAGCGERALRVIEQDGAIWKVGTTGGNRECLAGVGQYGKAPGDESTYYAFFGLTKTPPLLCVVECGRGGVVRRMQQYDNDTWRVTNAIDRVTWLGNSRLFVEAHVNPSLGIGIEIDLDTRKMEVYAGSVFTWDRSRCRVAYFCEPPHFGTPPEIPSKLMIGHDEICEVPRRIHSDLYWHPTENKLLALIPPSENEPGQVVVVEFPGGEPPNFTKMEVRLESH